MSDQVSASSVAIAYLARQADVLRTKQEPVRADAYDAVHASRVASRRARSTLRVWSSLFRQESVTELRQLLAWHGEQLGRPRDTEVLLAHMSDLFAETGVDGQAARRVLGELRQLHDAGHDYLVATMDSSRYELLMVRLADFVADPPVTQSGAAGQELSLLVGKAVARVARQREKALAMDEHAAILMWHEVRKSGKAVRYSIEAIRDAYGDDLDPLVKSWRRVTDEFGLLQDAAIVAELLHPIAEVAVRVGEDAAPYQALMQAQIAHSEDALAAGKQAVEQALAEVAALPALIA